MEFGWGEAGGILLQVAMGVSLAACAGLRAFLPLLVVGAFGRLGFVPLTGAFEWLSSWPALAVFGVAVVVELAADKFPVVDHLLDGGPVMNRASDYLVNLRIEEAVYDSHREGRRLRL